MPNSHVLRYPRTTASSRAAIPSLPISSLMYALPIRQLKGILNHVVQDVTLVSVEELKSTPIARLYMLNMSDKRKLILSLPPSPTNRLLRHEETALYSEATLISFLTASQKRQEGETPSKVEYKALPASPESIELIPILLRHSANNKEMGYSYSIFKPIDGVPLSTLSMYLSLSERQEVDTQIGMMARSLANITSPSKRFGMSDRVLLGPFTTNSSSAAKSLGSKTWSEAFNTLLECILRDGEDMAVILPYGAIRAHFQSLIWRLDAVVLPRLVILNICDESNVMVERIPEEGRSIHPTNIVKVTGLRSWGLGVFGDPLIASCFDDSSESFMEGWHTGGDSLIEDEEGAADRRLLYRCYQAIVGVVKEYYRPQNDSSRRELEARKKLTSALAELENTSATGDILLKRSRGGSNCVQGLKRQRIETE